MRQNRPSCCRPLRPGMHGGLEETSIRSGMLVGLAPPMMSSYLPCLRQWLGPVTLLPTRTLISSSSSHIYSDYYVTLELSSFLYLCYTSCYQFILGQALLCEASSELDSNCNTLLHFFELPRYLEVLLFITSNSRTTTPD